MGPYRGARPTLAKFISAISLALVSIALAAGSSSAATTIGHSCPLFDGNSNALYWDSGGIATTSGVITSWGYDFQSGSGATPYTVYLVVLQPSASPTSWSVVSTATLPLQWLGNSGTARLPIKAGQAIALWSDVGSWYCDSLPGTTIWAANMASVPTAGTPVAVAASGTGYGVPIHASIEADVDGDDYGDETQDHCTQSAKFQTCPIANATAKAKAGKTAVTFNFANPGETTLSATAKVRIPKSGRRKARTLKLKAKPVAVANGNAGKLSLKYPNALRSALKNLSKRKKLKLKVAVTSTGIANTATKTYTVNLRGQKR